MSMPPTESVKYLVTIPRFAMLAVHLFLVVKCVTGAELSAATQYSKSKVDSDSSDLACNRWLDRARPRKRSGEDRALRRLTARCRIALKFECRLSCKYTNMGRSSRHSKNAGTMGAEGLTYNERRGLGHGTVRERLGKVTTSDAQTQDTNRHILWQSEDNRHGSKGKILGKVAACLLHSLLSGYDLIFQSCGSACNLLSRFDHYLRSWPAGCCGELL